MTKNRTYSAITVILLFTLIQMTTGCAGNPSTEAAASVQETTEPIRIMSFNIRFDNPADGPDAWPHRKEMVASVMRFHHADLVGTQEGLINQLEDLDGLLPEFDWVGIGRDQGDERGEFCAIYYRPDRFEMIDSSTFWLSETPDEPGSQSWDAALPRIVTWAKLGDRLNDREFYVFNTHFDHRGQEARLQSANLILEKIDEIAGDTPVIMIGDLNITEDQEPYSVLADPDIGPVRIELSDGFYHSRYGHHGPTTTWTGFDRIIPDRRIDYIFTGPGFSVIHHGILADVVDGRFPSDHLPVLAEIEFR